MDDKKALENLINACKKASPHFKDVKQTLRRRRKCEGATAYDRAINILDKGLLEAIKFRDKEMGK